jgi:hypothetical protein
VDNIGNDGSGTHCGDTKSFYSPVENGRVVISKIEIIENILAKNAIKKFFKQKKIFIKKILHKIRKKIYKLNYIK